MSIGMIVNVDKNEVTKRNLYTIKTKYGIEHYETMASKSDDRIIKGVMVELDWYTNLYTTMVNSIKYMEAC